MVLAAVAAALGGLGLWGLVRLLGSRGDETGWETAVVTRGPMVVTVNESGEISAENQTRIANELRWPVIILEVVEEGTRVAEGDEIIRFECKELTETIERVELEVTSAENDMIQAERNVELKAEEMRNRVVNAENRLTDAQAAMERFVNQDRDQRLEDARSDIYFAQEELAQARERYELKVEVNEDPNLGSPYSENEIESERLNVERLELRLAKAEREVHILEQYELPRLQRERETAVRDAQLNLRRERLEEEAQNYLAQTRADAQRRDYELRAERLAELREDEERLVITADRPGLIVYDTGWRSEFQIEIGAEVSPRQQLMIIPDMTSLRVETKVYEGQIEDVEIGTPAVITMDARREQTFRGEVSKVSVLPSEQHRWWNPTFRVFPIWVEFDELPEGVKPKMTAQVELILARMDNVLSVPIAAVYTEQERTFCWVLEDGQPRQRNVRAGRMNDSRTHILEGLSEGEVVLLAPPEGYEVQPRRRQAESQPAEAGPPAAPAPDAGRERPQRDDDADDAPADSNAASRPATPPADAATQQTNEQDQ